MLGELLLPEIEELIEARDFAALRESLAEFEPVDLADLFADLPPERVAVIFRILPREHAAAVFTYLPAEKQESLLKALGDEPVAAVLNAMAPDDRTALLEELPGGAAQRLIGLLTPEQRKVAVTLLGYPERSIGRRMTPDYVSIRREWTVAQVIAHLRQVGRDKETLNNLYIVDDHGKLIDDIRLRTIVLADPNSLVSDLLDAQYAFLHANDDQEEAVRAFKKYDRSSLPVVDSQDTLVGIVTVDDVLDVAEQEETEDVQKMAAVQALEEPFLNISAVGMFRKRYFWLVLLFGGELLTVSALARFEHALETIAILAVFIPLVIASGGNSGSQAASLVIRAMAVGHMGVRDWWHVLRREFVSGLMLGSILGIAAFLAAMIFGFFREHHGGTFDRRDVLVAFTIGTSLVGVVLFGTIAGSMMPVILKRLKFDPAVSSTPFVATMVDVTGILIYFGTATLLLMR